MRTAALAALATVTVFALAACGDDSSDTILGTGAVDRIGRPDVQSAQVTVDEAGIRTTFDADGAQVTIPVSSVSGTAGSTVNVTVALTALDSDDGPSGTASATLTADPTLVVVDVPGFVPPEDQADLVETLVRYTAGAGQGPASGQRSLFHTVSPMGIQMWAPWSLDAGTTTAVRVWVRDLTTGKLAPDVPVTLNDVTVLTDVAGQAAFDVAAPTDGSTSLQLEAAANVGGLSAKTTQGLTIVPEGAPQLFLSTDKPLYRPGQTIHIRALALARKDQTPLADQAITLEVLDGKDNKIFKEVTTTDAMGVASLTAPLASQVNVGDYTVRALMEDIQTARVVEVSEEKLPKFAVTTSLDAAWFAPGESITGVVSARYFFGKAVVGGQVTIETLGGGVPATIFSGTTDAEGLLPFELPDGAQSDLELAIEVVDSAGFTVVSGSKASVAVPQLTVELVPESQMIPAGESWSLYVFTRGPLGGPAAATCTAPGAASEGPFETGAAGVVVIEMAPETAATVSCTDADGLQGSGYKWVETDYTGTTLLTRTDQAIYEPGDAIDVTLVAPGATDAVYVDRVHRGRIVESLVAPVSDGVAQVAMQPAEGETGTLVITGYYVGDDEQVVAGDVTVYVQKPSAQVSLTTHEPEYLPGGEAELTFKVTDPAGNGQAAAIGVTIADEAVFALAGSVGPDDVAGFFLLADEPSAVHPFAFDAPTDASQKAAAAALALSGPAPPAGASGLTTFALQSQVKQAFSPWMSELRYELIEAVQQGVDTGSLNQSNIVSAVLDVEFYDYWGQEIERTAQLDEGYWEDYLYVWMSSHGPDETAETWDDWSSSFTIYLPKEQGDNDADGAGGAAGEGPASAPSDGDWAADEGGDDAGWDNEPGADKSEEAEGPKKRDDFPETLYVNPALITDATGTATVTLPMADAITEWRVSMIANTAGGLVGGGTSGITVFQDFFVDTDLPGRLTQNDRLELPIGVFNFSDIEQEVTVEVAAAEWFAFTGAPSAVITAPPGSSVAVPIGVEILLAGTHALEVTATGETGADAVIRTATVTPDGQRRDVSNSGPLEGSMALTVNFPQDAIEGGHDALLKLMGGPSAQMVDGVDALLKTPRGCFEPMMNSTWINALVLDYMSWTGSTNQTLRDMALANLDDGIQQCLTFECTGGGFTWFGDPDPAHPILTALALVMFEDINVHKEVDEGMVTRARNYLEGQQQGDGHWESGQGTKNQLMPWDHLRTTCTVTTGLAMNGDGDAGKLGQAVAWISEALTDEMDTYTLAMCANALLAAAPDDPDTDAIVADLLDRAETEGDLTWWNSEYPGISNAGGEVIAVETTALAAQALYRLDTPPVMVEGALKFLAGKKSPDGNFLSTQGTIQSLRAFVAAAKFAAGDTNADVTVSVDGQVVYETHIDADNRDVVHYVSLNAFVGGEQLDVDIDYAGEGKLYYQLAASHYEPWDPATRAQGPNLDVDVQWSPTELSVGEVTTATVTVSNSGVDVGPGDMPMVDVGVPPGFDADLSNLDAAVVADPNVARYEVKGERIVIYLHHLGGEEAPETFEVQLPMSPRFPMEVTTPAAKTWEFFKPEAYSESIPVVLTVNPAG